MSEATLVPELAVGKVGAHLRFDLVVVALSFVRQGVEDGSAAGVLLAQAVNVAISLVKSEALLVRGGHFWMQRFGKSSMDVWTN